MSEEETLNEAFEKYLESTLSKESRQKLIKEYGDEIASEVNAIYQDAMQAPVDWKTATIDSALPILHELLQNKYPWLSSKARTKINYAFIMTGK